MHQGAEGGNEASDHPSPMRMPLTMTLLHHGRKWPHQEMPWRRKRSYWMLWGHGPGARCRGPDPRVFPQGTLFLGCSKPLITPSMTVAVTTSAPTAPSWQTIFAWVLEPRGKLTGTRPAQAPGLKEITWSLREGNAPKTMVNFPQERTPMPKLWVGTTTKTMMSTWLQQDVRAGSIYVNSVTASMSLVSLSPAAMAVDCPRAMLEDLTDVGEWRLSLPLPLKVVPLWWNCVLEAISRILYRIVISLSFFVPIVGVNLIVLSLVL